MTVLSILSSNSCFCILHLLHSFIVPFSDTLNRVTFFVPENSDY
nr:MAG TPA: hypothetical protein [Caudoviricetes sp.]DAR36814.1 MAG TPA: hypothetical protein [Caudoviricetes sp.]DAY58517.1 MAG TPA: hypothetical protein [Caudoviricetes sp.]